MSESDRPDQPPSIPGPDRSPGRDGDGETGPTTLDDLRHPKQVRTLRRLPRLIAGAAGLAYRSGRSRLLVALGLQVGGSVLLVVQLFATRRLITQLLADRRSGDFTSVVPALVVVVVAFGASGAMQVMREEVQRVLSELVARYTLERVLEAATAVDLIHFEDADFHDRLQRATINASIRPLEMTTGVLSVAASLLSSAAVAVTLLVIQPLILALALVAVLPLAVANVWVGRSFYEFTVSQTPLDRRRLYIQSLLVTKDPAKEVRAYQLSDHVRGEWKGLYDRRLSELRALARKRSLQGVAASLLTMVVLGGTLGLLVLLVSDGHTSIAGAATAARALVLLGTQLDALAGGMGNLYQSALFIEDFNDFVEPVAHGFEADRTAASRAPAPAAVLFQDFVKFLMSARTNVEMGRWQSIGDDERFDRAVGRAGARTILDVLPKGAETLLGPEFYHGSDLSGGQWQRVALARAFFRDADLIILDEPTASLDPRAEAELFEAVKALFVGRSVLLISHRLASVRLADYIYVLDRGRIAEHGSHDQLMAQEGLYCELFTMQASAFGLYPAPGPPDASGPRGC